MFTLIVSMFALLYVTTAIASIVTLATSPSFERTVTIDHAPMTIIQAKNVIVEAFFPVDLSYAHYHASAIIEDWIVNPSEEKRIQYDILHHYHV
jgi:hypothetical protein